MKVSINQDINVDAFSLNGSVGNHKMKCKLSSKQV